MATPLQNRKRRNRNYSDTDLDNTSRISLYLLGKKFKFGDVVKIIKSLIYTFPALLRQPDCFANSVKCKRKKLFA